MFSILFDFDIKVKEYIQIFVNKRRSEQNNRYLM